MELNPTLDVSKIKKVAINDVRPNTWNPKDKDTREYKDIVESIKVNGLRGFITVRYNPNNDTHYEIIDGEQRWTGAKELGYKEIAVYDEGDVPDREAKELTIWWQVQNPFNQVSLAHLVTDMLEQYESIKVPFTEKELEKMKEMSRFNWESFKKPTETSKPPEMGELLKTFSVQLTTTQYDIIQQAIEKCKKDTTVTITDSKALEFICAEYINTPVGM